MDLMPLVPEISLAVLAFAILVIDWFLPASRKPVLAYCSILGISLEYLLVHFVHLFAFHRHGRLFSFPDSADLTAVFRGRQVFQGFVLDGFGLFFKQLFLLAALFVSVFSWVFFRGKEENSGEYYVLLLLVTLGAFFLVSASDLLMVFVSFELMSIPLYVLAGFLKKDFKSNEAGLKYFFIGAVTSAFMVFGMSLVYASLGTLDLRHLTSPGPVTLTRLSEDPVLFIGILFILGTLMFKMAVVPFHMWAPDVYEGAPAPVAAFLAVVPKIAVAAVFLRIFEAGMPESAPLWSAVFAVLAALSMTVGNLAAFYQQNLKRLLAYSGISQMGYILVGLAAIAPTGLSSPPFLQLGFQSALFYAAAYLFAELTAFGVVTYLSREGRDTVNSCRGLAAQYPVAALVLLLAVFSLAGIPPLAGFAGKFYLFVAAFSRGLYGLVILAFANSVASLFYYLRIARAMYLEEPAGGFALEPFSLPLEAALGITCFAVVLFGVFPRLLADTTQSALQRFLSAF